MISYVIAIACIAWYEGMEMLYKFLHAVTVAHFTDQNRISKPFYCIRCVLVCKIGFTNWNVKIALLRESTIAKLFQTGADRHNGILMSLLLLVAETMIIMLRIEIEYLHGIDNNVLLIFFFPPAKHRYEPFQNVSLSSLLSMKSGFNKFQKNILREETANIKNFTG